MRSIDDGLHPKNSCEKTLFSAVYWSRGGRSIAMGVVDDRRRRDGIAARSKSISTGKLLSSRVELLDWKSSLEVEMNGKPIYRVDHVVVGSGKCSDDELF